MRRTKHVSYTFLLLVAFLLVACGGGEQQTGQKKSGVDEGAAAEAVKPGSYEAPKVAEPCGNDCPYEGDTVTVTVNTAGKEGPSPVPSTRCATSSRRRPARSWRSWSCLSPSTSPS